MTDPDALAVFIVASLALLIVPGPAVLYIVAQSIDGGRKAGLVAMLGIQTGGLVHVLAATVGLSAVIASSAIAFNVVRYLGAAYLIVVGILTLLRKESVEEVVQPAPTRKRRLYVQGIVVNILNPKTALFFLAFLPQFVDEGAGHVPLQLLALGLIFVALATITDGIWAFSAGTAGDWLRRSRGFVRIRRYVSGSVFVALGVLTAVASPHRTK